MKIYTLNKVQLSFALLVAVIIFTSVFFLYNENIFVKTSAKSGTSWGLGFHSQEKQPTAPMSADKLKEYNAFYVGNEKEQVIYLTFDAGYENGYTTSILDTLKNNGVSAAFFLVGNYFETNPELVLRMAEEGHIVGNHTNKHLDMTKLTSIDEFKAQLTPIEEKYEEITGKKLQKFYRPPEGKFNTDNLAWAKECGYNTVFWSLSYVDWLQNDVKTKDYAFEKLLPRLHNGCVLLLHSTSETNEKMLDEFIKKCKSEGYTFRSLNELKAENCKCGDECKDGCKCGCK